MLDVLLDRDSPDAVITAFWKEPSDAVSLRASRDERLDYRSATDPLLGAIGLVVSALAMQAPID